MAILSFQTLTPEQIYEEKLEKMHNDFINAVNHEVIPKINWKEFAEAQAVKDNSYAAGILAELHNAYGCDRLCRRGQHQRRYCSKCGYYNSDYDHSVCYHTRTRTYWDGCDWEEYCQDCGALVDWGTSHGSTYTTWSGCHWYDYCRDCGELMDSGVSHSYSYGSWEYYNTTRHRRAATCTSCGETTYDYGNHSKKNTAVPYNSTQHKYGSYCATCQSFIGSVSYQDHTFTYGSWQNYNGTQHRRLRTCSACGYSDYEYANHSLSYGSWSSANASQHKRTVSCSCGYSTTEYADHTLTVTRQSISDTQHKVTSKCSVCGYSC